MNTTRFRGLNTQTRLSLFFAISILVTLTSLPAETPLDRSSALEARLRVSASRFQNKSREQLSVDLPRCLLPYYADSLGPFPNPVNTTVYDRPEFLVENIIKKRIFPNPSVF